MAAFAGTQKPFYASMTTVVSFDISGKPLRDPLTGGDSKEVLNLISQHVEPRVKAIIDGLKASSKKFEDPDFGPTTKDPLGALSFYGSAIPSPAGSKYPKPEDLRWDRPQYDDKDLFGKKEEGGGEGHEDQEEEEQDEEEEEEEEEEEGGVWCKHGALFQGGSGANDVIQGQLGDCWFLGALAVMGTKQNLLANCFWQQEKFREFGIFVCRFYKDTSMVYVIIDDRVPVKAKDGKPIFAACKDPNELWVPLIEKAYAKLHGCYKALIGGYSHYALADMTGFAPRLVVMKPGFPGFSDKSDKEDVWSMLERYSKWECLMGTSIQSNPKENHKVEAEAGMGLHMGHAYSFLGLGTIQHRKDENDPKSEMLTKRLVRLRNPWGRGEWEGTYSDRSDEMEREDIKMELNKYAKQFNMKPEEDEDEADDEEKEIGNFNDGCFYMPFDEWFERFTSLFVAVNFPNGTQEALTDVVAWTGTRAKGSWSGEAGGNREMASWLSNPKLRFKLNPDSSMPPKKYYDVFVGIYIKDSRLTMGFDYFKDPLYATPLAFDIVTKDFVDKFEKPLGKDAKIEQGQTMTVKPEQPKQAPYNFGTTQVEIRLQAGVEYYIVPSLYKRSLPGEYFLTVFAECDFDLEGGLKASFASQPMIKGGGGGGGGAGGMGSGGGSAPNVVASGASSSAEALPPPAPANTMSKAQYFEKMEALRERLVAEAKTLGVNTKSIKSVFPTVDWDAAKAGGAGGSGGGLSYAEFKKALMGVGFNLTDLSDADLQVLDKDDDKTISPIEFYDFFRTGMNMDEEQANPPPPPPVDDLAFKATDMEGVLMVRINEAHALRETKAWFSSLAAPAGKGGDSGATGGGDANSASTFNPSARVAIRYDKATRDKALERASKIKTTRASSEEQAKRDLDKAKAKLSAGQGQATALLPTTQPLSADELAAELLIMDSLPPSPEGRLLGQTGFLTAKSLQDNHDDAKTHKSVLYALIENGANAAAAKLHADPELQSAEVKRTEALALLRKQKQASAGEARKGEIEEAGALRLKVRLEAKTDRRNLTRDEPVMRLLGLSGGASELYSKEWYKPHMGDDLTLLRKPREIQSASGANIKAVRLFCKCKFSTVAALVSFRRFGKCPKCRSTPRDSAAAAAAGYDLSTPGKDAVAHSAAAGLGSTSDVVAVTGVAATPGKVPDSSIYVQLEGSKEDKAEIRCKFKGPEPSASLTSKEDQKKLKPDDFLLVTADGTSCIDGKPIDDKDKDKGLDIVCNIYDALGRISQIEKEDSHVRVYRRGNLLLDGDIFDVIIDRVVDIVESKSKIGRISEMNRQMKRMLGGGTRATVTKDSFKVFSRAVSNIPSPSVTSKAAPGGGPVKLGTTPRAKTPGHASTTRHKSSAQTARELNDARLQLGGLAAADSIERYEEIYRRLVLIPTVMLSELDGERTLPAETSRDGSNIQVGTLGAFARHVFDRFDANTDGTITLEEFKTALRDMNIDVSDDDALTMFNRFEHNMDGTIDWNEFSDFFKNHIVSEASVESHGEAFRATRPMRQLLGEIHPTLHKVCSWLVEKRCKNVEVYITAVLQGSGASDVPLTTPVSGSAESGEFVLPDNAILHVLESASTSSNVHILKRLELAVTHTEMERINYVFKHDLRLLMRFAAAPSVDLSSVLTKVLEKIHLGLRLRAGGSASSSSSSASMGHGSTTPDSTAVSSIAVAGSQLVAKSSRGCELSGENVARLWSVMSSFVANKSGAAAHATTNQSHRKSHVRTNDMADFFVSLMTGIGGVGGEGSDGSLQISPRAAAAAAAAPQLQSPRSGGGQQQAQPSELTMDGVAVDTLCRTVVDGITATPWNRGKSGFVSFSAFEAFLREGHINQIERKLRYLLDLELGLAGPTTWALVHVWLNESKSEAVVLVNEPLGGNVYKVVVNEDLSALPITGGSDETLKRECGGLRALFPWFDDLKAKLMLPVSGTAAGAGAAAGLFQSTFSNHARFLDESSFSLYNPFDTPEEDAAVSDFVARLRIVKGGVSGAQDPDKKVVLAEDPRFVGQLKKLLDNSTLPFFCNCNETSLFFDIDRETLAVSAGTIRQLVFGHLRKQKAILSFLTSVMSDMRVVLSSYNSGVKVSMKWVEMLAHLTEYRNPFLSVELKPKFLLPHQYIYRPDESSSAFTGLEAADPLAVQRSAVVVDGGAHPCFNTSFKISFKPPKMTSCKLLSTEIHRMDIDGQSKWVILMVREARRDASTDPDLSYEVTNPDTLRVETRYRNLPAEEQTFRFITIYDPRTATDYQCGVKRGCKLYEELLMTPGDGGWSETQLDKLKLEFDALGSTTPHQSILEAMGVDAKANFLKEFKETESLSYAQLVHANTEAEIKAIENQAKRKVCETMGDREAAFENLTGSMNFVQFLKVLDQTQLLTLPDTLQAPSGDASEDQQKVAAFKVEVEKFYSLFATKNEAELDVELKKNTELKRLYIIFVKEVGAVSSVPDSGAGNLTFEKKSVAAPEVTGGATIATPNSKQPTAAVATSPPPTSQAIVNLKDRKEFLVQWLCRDKTERLVFEAAKMVVLADYNGDKRITFRDYARFKSVPIGHKSGHYNPRQAGPTPLSDFMEHLEDAATDDMIILGPAITPRLLITVQNNRGKQVDAIGSCQMSISTVLSGSGVGKEQWVTLTHTPSEDSDSGAEPGAGAGAGAGPATSQSSSAATAIRAGRLQVELGFRKQADIDAERESEEKRKAGGSRPGSKANSRANSRPNTPRQLTASAAALFAGPASAATEKLLAQTQAERDKLAAQIKEERARAAELAAQLKAAELRHEEEQRRLLAETEDAKNKAAADASAAAAAAAAAAAGSSKGGTSVAGPDSVLLKKLEELEAFKKRAEAEEAKRTQQPSTRVADHKLTSELEAHKAQLAALQKEKKAVEDKLAKALAAGAAPGANAPHALSPKAAGDGGNGKGKDKQAAPEPLSLSGNNFAPGVGPGSGPVRPATAAPSASGARGSKNIAGVKNAAEAWLDWNTAELPAGWDRKRDATTGKIYYVDHVNKKTQWKHPLQATGGPLTSDSDSGPARASSSSEAKGTKHEDPEDEANDD